MRICCAVIPRFMLLGLLSLSSAMKVSAQASAPSAGAVSQQPAAANVRGQVADPSGALIPGVKITMTTDAGGEVASVVSDASGSFLVRGLKPGDYVVRATFDGFLPFQSAI